MQSSPASFDSTAHRLTLTDALRATFAERGYLKFDGVVDKQRLADLATRIENEYYRARSSGQLFPGGGSAGGGVLHGHLNCFPGAVSRFVYDTLEERGIIDIVRELSGRALRMPNIGCNLNLPGSAAQNDHVDGYAETAFLIVNVACVDTHITNGSMEVMPGTNRREYKYWQLLLERPERLRMAMTQGDVVIRPSMLWHRGMPNLSQRPRPMLAFTWENGGSAEADPYAAHGGEITFLPNRYATDWKGRMRERAFVAAPRLGTAYRVVRSFFDA